MRRLLSSLASLSILSGTTFAISLKSWAYLVAWNWFFAHSANGGAFLKILMVGLDIADQIFELHLADAFRERPYCLTRVVGPAVHTWR